MSAFAKDAFGNALATEVIKYGQNAPVRALRKEIAETSPALLETFESWIENGGTADSFKKFMANEKFASGIEQIQNAKDSAGTASSSRADDYAIVGDKKLPVNEIERPTADKIFGGSSQVLQGLSELSETVHLEEIAMMSKVILFGPASVIMDEAMGSIINNLAGDKIASGLHAAGVQLTAMAWGESADQTRALINANNNYDDSWLLDNSLNDAQRTEMLGYERAANIGYDRSRSAAGASDFLVLGMMALGAKQGFDLLRSRGLYKVGSYQDLKGTVPGLDAHHVGQTALMKDMIPDYDRKTAPSILVPKEGHTIKGPNGIVSRNTEGLTTPRQVLARDINELRRVYPDVPNEQLQKLIQMNKDMYPDSFKKKK